LTAPIDFHSGIGSPQNSCYGFPMGVGQSISAVLVFLTGLLPASCHREKTRPQTPPPPMLQTNVVVDPARRDLGQLWLTNHTDITLHFVSGEDCTFRTRALDRGALQLGISLEIKNDYGDTKRFYSTQIDALVGKPVILPIGELKLQFTPFLSTNE
jgi:hypothetical protein